MLILIFISVAPHRPLGIRMRVRAFLYPLLKAPMIKVAKFTSPVRANIPGPGPAE